jgi:hypothetical protein
MVEMGYDIYYIFTRTGVQIILLHIAKWKMGLRDCKVLLNDMGIFYLFRTELEGWSR